MTNNEIIKALEVCASKHLGCRDGCPLNGTGASCIKELTRASLDFINHQRAENERYKGVIKILEKDVQTAKNRKNTRPPNRERR